MRLRFPDGHAREVVGPKKPPRESPTLSVAGLPESLIPPHHTPVSAAQVPEPPATAPSFSAPLLLTAAEAAALCHVSLRTWRAWDARGKIPPPVRIGRSVFWRPKELAAWVEEGCPDREMWEALRN